MSRRVWFLVRLPVCLFLGASAGYGFSFLVSTDPQALLRMSPETAATLGVMALPPFLTALGALVGLGFAGPPPRKDLRGEHYLDDELLRAEYRASFERRDTQKPPLA